MKNTKEVLLPIKVAKGYYCWDGHQRCCAYFDNTVEGCDLGFYPIKRSTTGRYPKPNACLELKEVK